MKFLIKIPVLFIVLTSFVLAQEQQDRLFNTDSQHTIQVQLYKPDDWDSIRARFDYQNDSLTYTPVKIKIDNDIFDSVGLSIKGNTAIMPDISFKKYPFKIDLNEFKKGQKFDNVKKFNLNTKEFDNNIIMNNLFASFQLPYLRVSRALVTMGSETLGEYLIVEQVDKTFLKRTFGNDNGNLYKGDKQADLRYLGEDQTVYEDRYTLKTNEEQNDYTALIHFIDILNNVKEEKAQEDSLRNNFDIDSYLKILSIQVVMGKHDDYFDKNHNYYLYHDNKINRFCFIPYDNDMVFGNQPLFIPSGNLPLLNRIFTNQSLKSQYLESICSVISKILSFFPAIQSKYHANYTSYIETTNTNSTYLKKELEKSGYSCPSTDIIDNMQQKKRAFTKYNGVQLKESNRQIHFTSDTDDMFTLTIFSMDGRTRFTHTVLGKNAYYNYADISFLPPGVYIAEFRSSRARIPIRIILPK